MIIDNQIKEIIERAYQVFENYTIGKKLQLCTHCCVTLEQEKNLVNTSLRTIPRELLESAYYESARNFSDRELWEMKHFLPRVLELVNGFEFPCHSVEITFTRLDLHKPEKWTKNEIDTLTEFSLAYFRKCLSIYPLPNNIKIDDIIVMFGIAHFDINLILKEWTNADTVESLLHLKDFVINRIEYKNLEPYKLTNAFSEKEPEEIIINWLKNKTVKKIFSEKIENEIMNNKLDEESINQLSWTYELMMK